eukprot:4092817-Prymnesium_polylepis.2
MQPTILSIHMNWSHEARLICSSIARTVLALKTAPRLRVVKVAQACTLAARVKHLAAGRLSPVEPSLDECVAVKDAHEAWVAG